MSGYTKEVTTATATWYICDECQFRTPYLAEIQTHIRMHHQVVTRDCGIYKMCYFATQEDADTFPPSSLNRGCYTWEGPGWYVRDYHHGEFIHKTARRWIAEWNEDIRFKQGKIELFEKFLAENPPPTEEET